MNAIDENEQDTDSYNKFTFVFSANDTQITIATRTKYTSTLLPHAI